MQTALASSTAKWTILVSLALGLNGQTPETVSTVSIMVGPTSVSLSASQTQQFKAYLKGSQNNYISWSISPALGTISRAGWYTAPSSIAAPAIVLVKATSTADPTKSAAAIVTLKVNGTVSITLAPASVSLTASKSQQFTATIAGTTQTGVSWSLSSAVGTISSSGLYTAPSSISAPASVVVKATSLADPTKTATATIALQPVVSAVSITAAPTSVNLTASKSQQFTATIAGTTQTGVSWTLNPPVGTVSNSGLYTAPAQISSAQSVMLTATSVADATKTALVVIALTASPVVGPLSISVTAPADGSQVSGSVAINASATGALVGAWLYVDGMPITAQMVAPPYTTNWNTGSIPDGPHSISAMAMDAAGNRSTTTIYVSVKNAAASPTSQVTLPLEVMGPSGYVATAQVNVPAPPAGSQRLWLQIHGLKYQSQASVQINSGPWLPIDDSTVTLLGLASAYGGIGGGFSTLKLTMILPAGTVVAGSNTIRFRFNGTDGVTSGFRVLGFNFWGSDGAGVLSSSTFVQDNPATWQAPSSLASDIAAGKSLWSTAALTTPGGPIRARCADCHAQDGRDLKYFNYSNNSIRVRSMFHGLTQQQGDQIASYIRSLNSPAPSGARPWNPPYQPGPGLDSKPVSEWAGGASLNAVLDSDSEMLPYLMPNGSTANWAWNAYMNAREIPIALQLPDWNRWLPTIHPLDAWGDSFTSSLFYANYQKIRSTLRWQDATTYKSLTSTAQFNLYDDDFVIPRTLPDTDAMWNDLAYVAKIYSIRLWEVVKLWEINQEFGLEGMGRIAFGPQSAERAWMANKLFFTSPFFMHIPKSSPGIGNGRRVTHTYLSFIWYQLQLILNDGNGTAEGTWPIDWGYATAYSYNDLPWDSDRSVARAGTAGLLTLWMVKSLQATGANGAKPLVMFPGQVSTWTEVSTSQKLQIMTEFCRAWLKRNQQSPKWAADPGELKFALPHLRYLGVDLVLLTQITTWAQSVWPNDNWASILTMPCGVYNAGEIKCQ